MAIQNKLSLTSAAGAAASWLMLALAAGFSEPAAADPTDYTALVGTDSSITVNQERVYFDGGGKLIFDCSFGDTKPFCGPGHRQNSIDNAAASADPATGELFGSAQASTSPACPPGGCGYAWFYTAGVGFSDTLWWDTFTLRAPGLPAGTVAQLKIDVLLDADLLSTPTETNWARALIANGGRDNGLAGLTLSGNGQQASFVTTVFSSAIDTPFRLVGLLQVSASASGMGQWGGSGFNQFGSAKGHAIYLMTVLTPDVTLDTASGHSYAAAVPEPSSLALWASGLALVGGFSARAGRQRLL
jgi:hypothetical protein